MAKHALDVKIDAIVKRSNALGNDIHVVALACLAHAQEFGDPRKMDRLVKGLHASCRPVALMEWAKKFSPITWNGDGDVGMTKADAKTYVPFDLDSANAEPYWTPAEVVKKPLTLEALKAMIAQMDKKVTNAEAGKAEVAEGENIVDMRAFVERAKLALAA